MTLFLILWSIFGLFNWLEVTLEFRRIPYLQPGIFSLPFFVIFGPIPNIQRFFE